MIKCITTDIQMNRPYKYIHNPFTIVQMFEEEVANYTGAPFAVAVDSCTSALFLCCVYNLVWQVTIPKKTYLSVPQAIKQAGGKVVFEDLEWEGIYRLKPYPIYDAAKRFTSGMYIEGSSMCLSFHIKKHLKIGKGGMILTDSYDLVEWAKRARYEGRGAIAYQKDDITTMGWNMYMTPQEAAHGLCLMQNIDMVNADLFENEGYVDLTQFSLFKNCAVL
jgi:dTDP-4-amino-4,6-dideoxygalactose transaminase